LEFEIWNLEFCISKKLKTKHLKTNKMAITRNPIIMNSSGTFDNMVMVVRHGQTYYRRKPLEFHYPNTKAQQKCTTAITVSNPPLKALKKYAHLKFTKVGQSQKDILMHHIMTYARIYENKKWKILYEKIILAIGPLSPVDELTVTHIENHNIRVSWLDNSGDYHAKPTDCMHIIFYNPSFKKNYTVEASLGKVSRAETQCAHPTPPNWKGKTIYIYVYSLSQNSRYISDTQCIKTIAS